MRGGARSGIRFQRRQLVDQPLIAFERALEILLLACDDVTELAERALQVREFFFNGVEAFLDMGQSSDMQLCLANRHALHQMETFPKSAPRNPFPGRRRFPLARVLNRQYQMS